MAYPQTYVGDDGTAHCNRPPHPNTAPTSAAS